MIYLRIHLTLAIHGINLIFFLFIGVVNVDGTMWKDQRRFLHERMRYFGMKHSGNGKEQLEARIMVSAGSSRN